MEQLYVDRYGARRCIQIITRFYAGEKVYEIFDNGRRFLDLVFRNGTWNELFRGINEESVEYGRVLDKIFVRAV